MVKTSRTEIEVEGLVLQDHPFVTYIAAIPGRWLLAHTTPSWRIKDPKKGFQRIVKESRARAIATSVLEQKRTFPNAITLATDLQSFKKHGARLVLPDSTKFLALRHVSWA